MRIYFLSLMFLMCAVLGGCAGTGQTEDGVLKQPVDAKTMKAVAEAVTGRELTDEELRKAYRDIRTDEDAKSAVKAIQDGMGDEQIQVKYSPKTGKRYSADLEYDPETGVKLLPVE